MTPHEDLRQLLALSAAGLLEPAEERLVREHVRDCAACRAELAELGDLGRDLGGLPAPQPSEALVARTQACMAAELDVLAGQRRNAALAAGLGLFAWAMALATWTLWRVLTGGAAAVQRIDPSGIFAWFVLAGFTTFLAAPAAAALAAFRPRKEGDSPC
jgi:hypothetical protein